MAQPVALRLRRSARRDIEAAKQWYEKEQPGLDLRFGQSLNRTLDIIAGNPRLFPVIYRDVHRAPLNLFPYSIYYLREAAGVLVLAVTHQARDPATWQGRR